MASILHHTSTPLRDLADNFEQLGAELHIACDAQESLERIAAAIDRFDAECTESEYTDTEAAWTLLNWIRVFCRGEEERRN